MKLRISISHYLAYFISAVIFSIIVSFNIYMGLAIIAIILFKLFYEKYGDDFIIVFSIVTFLTLVDSVLESYRWILQLFNTLLLFTSFVKKFGMKYTLYPRLPSFVEIFMVLFFVWLSISTIFSDYKIIGLMQIAHVLQFFTIFYFYFALIRTDRSLSIINLSLIIVSSVYITIIIYNLYQIKFDLSVIFYSSINIISSGYIGKNLVALFISLSIMLIICNMKNGIRKSYLKFSIYLFILLFILIYANSRASLFALILAVIMCLFIFNRKMFLITVVVFSIMILIILISPLYEYAEMLFRISNIGTGREYLISTATEIIKKNFVFGVGPSATKYEVYRNLPFMLGSAEEYFIRKSFDMYDVGHAHSFYLMFFSDLGIIGLMFTIILPVMYFKMAKDVYYKLKDNYWYNYIVFFIVFGFFIFIRAFFEPNGILIYGAITSDLPFWLIFGQLCFLYKKYIQCSIISQIISNTKTDSNSERELF